MKKSKPIKNILGKIFINFIVFLVLIINLNYVEATNTNNAAKTEEVDISSRIALIYDRTSGRILYEKNGNKQTPMASTTNVTDT